MAQSFRSMRDQDRAAGSHPLTEAIAKKLAAL
jgi:hypothetical protein